MMNVPLGDMFDRDVPLDFIDLLHRVCNLAKVGVAASDSVNNVRHVHAALEAQFELIYDLAGEAIMLAEVAEGEREKLAKAAQSTATSEQRLAAFAKATETQAPSKLLAEDGAPSKEMLAYCKATGCSLDWVFCGDMTAFFRVAAKANG